MSAHLRAALCAPSFWIRESRFPGIEFRILNARLQPTHPQKALLRSRRPSDFPLMFSDLFWFLLDFRPETRPKGPHPKLASRASASREQDSTQGLGNHELFELGSPSGALVGFSVKGRASWRRPNRTEPTVRIFVWLPFAEKVVFVSLVGLKGIDHHWNWFLFFFQGFEPNGSCSVASFPGFLFVVSVFLGFPSKPGIMEVGFALLLEATHSLSSWTIPLVATQATTIQHIHFVNVETHVET